MGNRLSSQSGRMERGEVPEVTPEEEELEAIEQEIISVSFDRDGLQDEIVVLDEKLMELETRQAVLLDQLRRSDGEHDER